METRRSISGAVDLGVDLAGEEAGAEVVVVALAGVAALAGAGKKEKAETRTVVEIIHLIHPSHMRSTLRLKSSFPIGVASPVRCKLKLSISFLTRMN